MSSCVQLDCHETTDTDESEFRPAKAARDGEAYEPDTIPDGFYLVGNSDSPQPVRPPSFPAESATDSHEVARPSGSRVCALAGAGSTHTAARCATTLVASESLVASLATLATQEWHKAMIEAVGKVCGILAAATVVVALGSRLFLRTYPLICAHGHT